MKQVLVVQKNTVNLSGHREVDFAVLVNGGIPAPTLEFTEGDNAEITVRNQTNEEVSIHWHGMLVPNAMDGVSNLTTPPILPGMSYVFKFPIRQVGTYWYHSHTGLQEQRGVFGAIVVHPKIEKYQVDRDVVVMLSDWTDENPDDVLKNLKKDGDYYQFKKNTVRSILGAMAAGQFKSYLENSWMRMSGMDLSDVGYDAFLINGKREQQLLMAHPGDTIRLRVINAASSSYFYVNLGQQYFTVVSADGQNVQPIQTKELLLGMAETYDVIFKVPEAKNFELRATAQDLSGSASAWIGMGEKEPVPARPPLNLYQMQHSGHEHHEGHTMNMAQESSGQTHEMDHTQMAGMAAGAHHHEGGAPEKLPDAMSKIEKLDVHGLRALSSTEFSPKAPRYEIKLELDGDMSRYTWFINDKIIGEDKYLDINKGDVVRFVLVNKSMMHHPMHLHGHFFRVLNGSDPFAPLKHTVDVAPFQTQTIEFLADEPGLWMLHCHNLYHMHSGMAKVVRYREFEAGHEAGHSDGHDAHDMDHWYNYGSLDAFTNQGQLYLRTSHTRYQFDARVESRRDDQWDAEGEVLGHRWLGKYWTLFAGGEAYNFESRGVIGASAIFPFGISSRGLNSRSRLTR